MHPNKSGQIACTQRLMGGGEFRIQNCDEIAFKLVCGAHLWCNRHCRTSPVVLERFWGEVWPKICRKFGPDISGQIACRYPDRCGARTGATAVPDFGRMPPTGGLPPPMPAAEPAPSNYGYLPPFGYLSGSWVIQNSYFWEGFLPIFG